MRWSILQSNVVTTYAERRSQLCNIVEETSIFNKIATRIRESGFLTAWHWESTTKNDFSGSF